MMSCEAVCRNQAGAKREPNIHKASFIERRLFYPGHLYYELTLSKTWQGM